MFSLSGSWIGVDVSQAWLDIAIGSKGKPFRVPNHVAGFTVILETLRSTAIAGIVVESTGYYHRGMATYLWEQGFPPSIVNPQQIKNYRKSGLKLAKTDRLDAQILARFGEERQPFTMFPRNESLQLLTDLVSARLDHVTSMTAWGNRRRNPHLPTLIHQEADEIIALHTEAIARLERCIAEVIASDPVLAERDALLQSVPGIALVRSAILLTCLPELGMLPSATLTSLVGLAPHANDSGKRKGHRYIRSGRSQVQSTMVLFAHTNRVHPIVRERRQQLIARNKEPLVADVAIARWMITVLNAMLTHGLRWEELDIVRNA